MEGGKQPGEDVGDENGTEQPSEDDRKKKAEGYLKTKSPAAL